MTAPHVLLVDDEDDIREVAEVSLHLVAGWQVATARSGEEAVVKALVEQPDVILLDVMMPGLDGPEALGRLRADPRTAAIPVVFLTAKAQASERERLVGLGAAGVISKPFDPLTLAEQVSGALGWLP
jgi:CheY-like chemotaxis protein